MASIGKARVCVLWAEELRAVAKALAAVKEAAERNRSRRSVVE